MNNRRYFYISTVLVVIAAAYLPYLMTVRPGYAGYDYLYFIPRLFEGMLFMAGQGLSIPLYSISFCGGLPYYGDPQTLFYSLPQLLTYLFSPWTAILISTGSLIVLGACAIFFLVRDVFKFEGPAASLAAVLFATNGFYRHRMLVGHLSYQAYAVIPLIAFLLLSARVSTRLAVTGLAFAGAYFVHSGGHFVSFIMVPSVLVIVCLKYVYAGTGEEIGFRELLLRGAVGGLGALLLSSGKLIAVASFMRQFPRRAGFDESLGLIDGVQLVVGQLFLPGLFAPFQWGHWEYVASLTPFVLLLCIPGICRLPAEVLKKRSLQKTLAGVVLLLCVLFVFQFATANGLLFELLKEVPPFSSLRIGMRFTSVYVFVVIIVAAAGLQSIRSARWRYLLCVVVMASALLQPALERETAAGYMAFSLEFHDEFDQKVRDATPEELKLQEIERSKGSDLPVMFRMNSNKVCLAPNFKRSPARTLAVGPVDQIIDGHFNFTDPSCFVYPEVRRCAPGDKIKVADQKNFEQLRMHRNPDWEISTAQSAGDLVAVAALFLFAIIAAYEVVSMLKKRI